jgi:hypothetical protein
VKELVLFVFYGAKIVFFLNQLSIFNFTLDGGAVILRTVLFNNNRAQNGGVDSPVTRGGFPISTAPYPTTALGHSRQVKAKRHPKLGNTLFTISFIPSPKCALHYLLCVILSKKVSGTDYAGCTDGVGYPPSQNDKS